MSHIRKIIPRSEAIAKNWRNFDWASLFSVILYPAIGITTLALSIGIGLAFEGVRIYWWYAPIGVAVALFTLVICNHGIGALHRIWQHKAGELKWPAEIIVAINAVIAMQGKFTDWINYHSQHHRFSDQPGDPHNPSEGTIWAWFGWILWRDENDRKRPTPMWLKKSVVVLFADKYYLSLTVLIHLIIPAVIYGVVALWRAARWSSPS